MKRGIFLTLVILFLAEGWFPVGKDTPSVGSQESAATPVLNVKSIHPLPEWDDAEDLHPGRNVPKDSSGSHLKLGLPVGLLAMLLFFLMWKFLLGQE